MDSVRRSPGTRRLSSPANMHSYRPHIPRSRSNTIRRRRLLQPLSPAALKSLAPLNLDIPISSNPDQPVGETSLYLVVLGHLADLEARLHAQTSSTALEVLNNLRDEVTSFFTLPDHGDDRDFLRLRARYAELSTLSLDEAKNRLVALGPLDALSDAKDRLIRWADEITAPALSALPDLSLSDLHARLAELCELLPADVSSATDRLVTFVESLIEDDEDGGVSYVNSDVGHSGGKNEDEIAVALKLSEGGRRLIRYVDMPEKWRNNEFVEGGYRFIPGAQWPALVRSALEVHNETLNIHTHFIPLLAVLFALPLPWPELPSTWASNLPISFTPLPPSPVDALPKTLFLLAAAACLTCSTIWHILAGCADLWLLEAGARVDYVGIGWLISASVSGVVYYGFACQPGWTRVYTTIAIATGIAGSILPFQSWFNERRNKKWRIAFFLTCACSAAVPLAHLAWRHSMSDMWSFIRPLVPSFACYLAGTAFYATHFPECSFPGKFDLAGSHVIWHVFIVLGVREHWKGMAVLHATSHTFSCAS